MSVYDREYSQEYYRRNREKILKRTRAWQELNKEKRRKIWNRWRKNHREVENANWRKRYKKRREAYEKEYGTMGRNIHNVRVRKYLINPEYYKEKLQGKLSAEQLEIAFYYLDNPNGSLYKTGRAFHKSQERVRQIVYKTLYKIWKMKEEVMEEKNNKPFIKQEKIISPEKRPFTRDNYNEIKDLLYKGESVSEIRRITGRATSLIGAARDSKDYEDYYMIRRELATQYYENRVAEKRNEKLEESSPTTIEQNGTPVTFRGTLPGSPSSHRQAFADAIDDFIKAEVEIQLKEKLERLMKELE